MMHPDGGWGSETLSLTAFASPITKAVSKKSHVTSCAVTYEPQQDLHGYDSPWPSGGGKNKFQITQTAGTVGDVTFTVMTDSAGNVTGLKASGTISANANIIVATAVITEAGVYRFSGLTTGSSSTAIVQLRDSSDQIISTRSTDESGDITLSIGTYTCIFRVINGATLSDIEIKPMLRLASSASGYSPYSNICPITGWSGCVTVAVPDSDKWHQIKDIVSTGKADKVYKIGDQIDDTWSPSTGTSYDAPWDVVHHFPNGDMALNWHYAFPTGIAFDAPEAIYYAPSGGLAAGTYHIAIGTAYGTGWSTSKHIQFTLTSAMDEGDQLYIDCGTNNANDPTNGRTWNVYAKGSTTSKQSGTTSDGTDGTLLGTIGATNAHKAEGNLNGISRVVYGYGRWSQSAHRQWLNSTAAAGAWWTPQNPWDRPPEQHGSVRGFLAGCSAEFLDILEPVDVVTALNTVEGFTETSETTQDKIFLPSLQEMYIKPQLANVEGVDWDYNKALAAEAGLTGKFAQYGTYEILKKYNVSSKSSAVTVFLRSCSRGYASSEWYVYSSGSVGNYYAYNALRGCPACIIKKSSPQRGTVIETTFPSTQYGGTADVVLGSGSEKWEKYVPVITSLQSINQYGIANFVFNFPQATFNVTGAMCYVLPAQRSLISATTDAGFHVVADATTGYLRLESSWASTVEQANQWVADSGCYIVHNITPTTFTFTPSSLDLQKGDNECWATMANE